MAANVLVIDGQGGGLGRQLVAAIAAACPEAELTAVGTNSLAANAMLKAGAARAATGENAVVVNCRHADVIVGPIGIVIADALLGDHPGDGRRRLPERCQAGTRAHQPLRKLCGRRARTARQPARERRRTESQSPVRRENLLKIEEAVATNSLSHGFAVPAPSRREPWRNGEL